jgi:hypothetical protein
MERKTAVVTAAEVAVALGKVKTVTSEEEKALRMRHGARVELNAPLARAAGDNEELADELLVIEMQLMRAMKARMTTAKAPVVSTSRNANKDKIVRALRKKK